MEPEQPMQERRKEGRSPSYLGGQITTDRRLIAIDCVVRNTSGTGARLVVPHATLLPDIFELHIPKKNCAYRVRACWRQTEDVGVEVVGAEDVAAPVQPKECRHRFRRPNGRPVDPYGNVGVASNAWDRNVLANDTCRRRRIDGHRMRAHRLEQLRSRRRPLHLCRDPDCGKPYGDLGIERVRSVHQ